MKIKKLFLSMPLFLSTTFIPLMTTSCGKNEIEKRQETANQIIKKSEKVRDVFNEIIDDPKIKANLKSGGLKDSDIEKLKSKINDLPSLTKTAVNQLVEDYKKMTPEEKEKNKKEFETAKEKNLKDIEQIKVADPNLYKSLKDKIEKSNNELELINNMMDFIIEEKEAIKSNLQKPLFGMLLSQVLKNLDLGKLLG